MTTPIRYPVYIPSKGRHDPCHTASVFARDGMPFSLVVEKAEFDLYADRFGADRVLVLPFSGRGLTAARNWIRDHAEAEGHERHWQFDDNIREFYYTTGGKGLPISPSLAIAAVEDFTDRYTNVGISGFNYSMFVPDRQEHLPPFYLNTHVYSACLFNHAMPYRWRLRYNDDTDLCLQALSNRWATIAFNVFNVDKIRTMLVNGGNTTDLYQDDGRTIMARALEGKWPGVVTTGRRFQRSQHIVKNAWRSFRFPLILKDDAEIPDESPYAMKLRQVLPEVKAPYIRQLLEKHG